MIKKAPSFSSLLTTFKNNLPSLTLLLAGFIAGIVWFGALRFFLVHPAETHYHANFAVYINGQREEFKSFTYYEEIAACTTAFADNPKGRVHMHDNVNDVIHVHDKRVTYTDFFENLNWSIGTDFIHTDATLYSNNDQAKMKFVLNGEQVSRIDNRVIGDKDRLLVSYGPADTDLDAQYKTVADSAEEVDQKQDPASCSGLNGPGEESVSARLKRAIGVAQ
jgi:hypothetical protein